MSRDRRPRAPHSRAFPLLHEHDPLLRAHCDAPLRTFLLVRGPGLPSAPARGPAPREPLAPAAVLVRGATGTAVAAGLALVGADHPGALDRAIGAALAWAAETGFEVLDLFGDRDEVAAELAAEELLKGLDLLPDDWAGDGTWPTPPAQVALRSLRAWARFPAAAVPRPAVVIGGVEHGLDGDHLVDDVVHALRRGEADPSVPGGRAALLHALPDGAVLERVLVDVLTDRGPRSLPGTRVGVPWLREPALVLDEAAAPLAWRSDALTLATDPRGAPVPAVEGVDGDPLRLRVPF
ncbi:hypothetical protein [Vallicoccus soli]|uniref:Uncharacterized protein n=1 Tax=Vallicoccus soli TaxID=2339232 RepID=A0A3A3YY66_9ACTN|nr:hypothetical protein [Vallicoccus soli]RJK94923.1 hypothetical protein D5H78_14130 [Vallicoccus soli]